MANYYASARSNEFRVKDIEAFKQAVSDYSIGVWVDDPATGLVSIYSKDLDGAGWPSWIYVELPDDAPDDAEDMGYVDLATIIAPHLAGGSVAIFFETGAEKLRYLIGTALAVNAAGETRFISLDQMFNLAKELGPEVRGW